MLSSSSELTLSKTIHSANDCHLGLSCERRPSFHPPAPCALLSTSGCRRSTNAVRRRTGRTGSPNTPKVMEWSSFGLLRTTARAGLNLEARAGLLRLLSEVQNGQADFSAILVYDVSRWGRFQDADKSSYWEYVCKRSGVAIHYCAEQFANDGSLSSVILKNLKRRMAGEYSRELSVKVFAGHCRLDRTRIVSHESQDATNLYGDDGQSLGPR